MKNGYILLAPGFEEVEAVTLIDYPRRAGLELLVVGIEASVSVKGSHGIELVPDINIDQIPQAHAPDFVIVPGGMPGASNLAASEAVNKLILKTYEHGGLVAAICAAPAVVLAPLGLLRGRKACCFPGFEKALADACLVHDRVCFDNRILTSRAAGTAAELSFALIAELCGVHEAEELRQSTLQPGY